MPGATSNIFVRSHWISILHLELEQVAKLRPVTPSTSSPGFSRRLSPFLRPPPDDRRSYSLNARRDKAERRGGNNRGVGLPPCFEYDRENNQFRSEASQIPGKLFDIPRNLYAPRPAGLEKVVRGIVHCLVLATASRRDFPAQFSIAFRLTER